MTKRGEAFVVLSVYFAIVSICEVRSQATNPQNWSKIAILDITKRNGESNAEPFALKHSLDALGIRYIVTDDPGEALQYSLLLVGGNLLNGTLTPKETNALFLYAEAGGTIVATRIEGSKYFSLFGLANPDASRQRFSVSFVDPATDPALKYLDRPEERKISLGNKKLYSEVVWTRTYRPKGSTVLANTEDGQGVFFVNEYGKGFAYAFGVAFSDVVLLPRMGGDYEAQRSWANGFEAGSDVFTLILKAVFEKTYSPAIYVSAVPFGKGTAFLLSHDVDAQDSFKNSIDFAALEKKHGVRSTFFVTTKYVGDESDIGYYDTTRIDYIRKVKEMGGDLGSHSVSHSNTFRSFGIGTPGLTKASYNPVINPSVFGELLVSKQILDTDFNGQNTVSFRAGELQVPTALFEVLVRSGYRYDSSYSANDIMGNFAYRMPIRDGADFKDSGIVEIPVTFDDSQGLLTEKNLAQSLTTWLDVVETNAGNEAISVMLIHPSVTSYKLSMEEKLLSALRGKDVWIGDISTYGDFWSKRDGLSFDVELSGTVLSIRITGDKLEPGIALVVTGSARISRIDCFNRNGNAIPCASVEKNGRIYVMKSGSTAF